jgi:hypothetical protein
MSLSHEDYWSQGSSRLDQYEKAVTNLVGMFPEPRRTLVGKMMVSEVGEQFMTAPASTRRAFHNAFPCGLVAHSLNVVEGAIKLAETLAPGRWPLHKVVFCALFHDLGKAGSGGHPYYVPTKDDWKLRRNEFWEVSKYEFMPNSEKSLFLLQQFGVTVDHEEAVAIRWNDGPGGEGNTGYAFNEPDLALIVHWADFWASKQEKAAGL